MKKIVLIGDSIRMGYGKYVKLAFEQAGTAQVFYPAENCRFSGYVLRNLGPWKAEMACGSDVDLIHWNAGLWDCLHMLDGLVHTELPTYRSNLARIHGIIQKLFPQAKQVFALTTSVIERLYAKRVYKRNNAEIEAYNDAAREVLTPLGVEFNDLYSVTAAAPESVHSDLTHFNNAEGARLLAGRVIACAEEQLGVKAAPLDYDALFEKPKEVLGY